MITNGDIWRIYMQKKRHIWPLREKRIRKYVLRCCCPVSRCSTESSVIPPKGPCRLPPCEIASSLRPSIRKAVASSPVTRQTKLLPCSVRSLATSPDALTHETAPSARVAEKPLSHRHPILRWRISFCTQYIHILLGPKLYVAFDFHVTNLTWFIENTCNIYISK